MYESANSVTLKWGEGGAKQTTAPHSTLYPNAPYSFSAGDSNGDEPFIKTFGSLLNCSGGILTIGQTRYRIQVQAQQQLPPAPPPPQKQQLLSEDTVAALTLFAKEYASKKSTIVLSDATFGSKHALLSMFFELPEKAATWPNMPSTSTLGKCPVFHWHNSNEDSPENRTAYMQHLKQNILLPDNYVFGDVQPIRSLLDVEIHGVDSETRRLRGTTDVVITKIENIQHSTIRNSIDAQLELKEPRNLASKDHSPQVIAEHFAASYLNPMLGIVSVLTDLCSSWTFYWFAYCKDASGGVALYRHVLQDTAAAAAAKYVLENTITGESSLTNPTGPTTLPTTFSSRLSFEDLMEKLSQATKAKRLRWGDNYMDPDNDSGTLGPQDQDGTGNAGGKQHGSASGSTPGDQAHASNNETGYTEHGRKHSESRQHGTRAAELLRLLAPQYNNEVADQLDLLDMVDEDEQYEIVRSFAANHIVPHMIGKRC